MKPGAGLEHEDLTDKIIGCAIEVHKKLGPGFLESMYEKPLSLSCRNNIFKVIGNERSSSNMIVLIGRHRLDLIIDDTIVVELKAAKNIEDVHFAIVKSYLKALGKEHGLIINFSKKILEVKRVIHI